MIKITENLYLDADEHQFIIISWNGKRDKHGNMQSSNRRYYSEASSVINGLTKIMLRQAVAISTDLHEISMRLDEISMRLDDIKKIADRVATNCLQHQSQNGLEA